MLDIQEGEPTKRGCYVAYINGPIDIVADRIFLTWMDGKWWYPLSPQAYRGHVYGFIGPLPIMPLE